MAFENDVVVVGGGGHVGLPLAIALASRGKRTVVYDVSEAAVEKIQRAQMPFIEPGADEVLARRRGRRDAHRVHRSGGGRDGGERRRRDRHAGRRAPQPRPERHPAGPRDVCSRSSATASCWCCAAPIYPGRDRAGRATWSPSLGRRHGCRASARSGSPSTRRWRSCSSCRRSCPVAHRAIARSGPAPVRRADRLDRRARAGRGRTREAVHQHVALHQVRRGRTSST